MFQFLFFIFLFGYGWFILLCLVGLQNKTVSVFETTIRVLGGLISAHQIASDYATVQFLLFYDNSNDTLEFISLGFVLWHIKNVLFGIGI